MNLRYLGTATLLLEYGGLRFLTDPAFDPAGTRYDFGPWYAPKSWFTSEKQYETPLAPEALGPLEAVLLSHDHHADNFDAAGRRAVEAWGARVVTTVAGAARLSKTPLAGRVSGLRWGEELVVGEVRITATPARHGPVGTPQIHEVNGFLLEAKGEPTLWISGDTVLFDGLRCALEELKGKGRRVDVAVVHCGGVRFPKVPLLGRDLFTFDAAQVVELCRLLAPKTIVPVHRSGWAHFLESEENVLRALKDAGFAESVRLLGLGEALQ